MIRNVFLIKMALLYANVHVKSWFVLYKKVECEQKDAMLDT